MTAFRYRVFLSYSHRDGDWADWLQPALEQYRVPSRLVGLRTGAGVVPERIAPVFRDRDELPSAADLGRKVADALEQSECMVVVCSPHAAQSRWVDEEIRLFRTLGRADRIFCLIVAGQPHASDWAGREHDECFPPSLRAHEPSARAAEPIAADVRPHRDSRATARLRLIAGILGVDLDDLRHRESRRRRLRLATLAAAAFALLALTTTLAINAIIARHAAERRQKQAEDLIGFMLGDLDDKLRQVNRLDILESVADKTVSYFETLPASDVTDDTLAQRARALMKLGAVRRDQGRTTEAIALFERARASSEDLRRRDPENAEYEVLDADCLTWLGFVDWSQGKLDRALARFLAAQSALDSARARRSNDASLLDMLAIAHTNAGRIYEARNELVKARNEYVNVIGLYEALTRMQPDKLDWRAELGYAHANLGLLARKEGRIEEAIAEYVADLQLKSALAVIDSKNNNRKEDLAAANAALGDALVHCGEVDAAERYFHVALAGANALLAIDATSTDWLEKAGLYELKVAQAQRMQSRLKDAGVHAGAALSRLRSLSSRDEENIVWQRRLAQALIETARQDLIGRRPGAARSRAKEARELAEKILSVQTRDEVGTLISAQSDLVLGDVESEASNQEAAIRAWRSAERALTSLGVEWGQPELAATYVRIELRLGKKDAVLETTKMLAASNYFSPDFVSDVEFHEIPYAEAGTLKQRVAPLLKEALESSAVKKPGTT